MPIRYPPSLDLALRPTPIVRLERLSRRLPVEVFVKRDDRTGLVRTGNKIRKLEFLLAEAKASGAGTILTCGGVQSNHARTVAAAAAALGMRSRLLLRGPADSPRTGNLLLDRLFGAEILFIDLATWRRVDEALEEEANTVRRAGGKPYVIPEGGSNALGSLGYARAVEEISEWSKREGVRFRAIVHATGSGGTTAGLVLGRAASGLEAEILGMAVCDDEAFFRARVDAILADACERFAPGLPISPSDYAILDAYKGIGYALSTPEELRFLRDVATEEGLVLDPVYTGKAFRGLLGEIEKGRFERGAKVLFVHTGGVFGLFAPGHDFASALALPPGR